MTTNKGTVNVCVLQGGSDCVCVENACIVDGSGSTPRAADSH